MRFMLCARDKASGTMTLVSDSSFATRREAVEAISGVFDVSGLSESDVFLVDLDAAIPVAVVPYLASDDSTEAAASAPGEVSAEEEPTALTEAPRESAPDTGEDESDADEPGSEVRLGFVEIDIDAWSCEDCIYITTCAKAGTLRPAECGAFQWRA